MFSGWFDPETGAKREAASYRRIAGTIGRAPADILFLSDLVDELDAAREAGLATVLVDRRAMLIGTGWRKLIRSHRLLIIVSLHNKCRGAHAATMRPFDVLRGSQNDTHIAVHGQTEAVHWETDCSRVIRLQ